MTGDDDQKKRIFFNALIEFDLYDAKNSIVKRTLWYPEKISLITMS